MDKQEKVTFKDFVMSGVTLAFAITAGVLIPVVFSFITTGF